MYCCFESLCQTRISNWIHNISMKMDIYSNISEVTIFLWNNSPGYCNISPTPSLIWRNHHHLTAPPPVLCAWLLHFVYRYHCPVFTVSPAVVCPVSTVCAGVETVTNWDGAPLHSPWCPAAALAVTHTLIDTYHHLVNVCCRVLLNHFQWALQQSLVRSVLSNTSYCEW